MDENGRIDLDRVVNRELMAELDAAEVALAPALAKFEALQGAADAARQELCAAEGRFNRTASAIASLNNVEVWSMGSYHREDTIERVGKALAEWRAILSPNGGKAVVR